MRRGRGAARRRCDRPRGRAHPVAGDEPHAQVGLQRREEQLGAHGLRQIVHAAGVARRLPGVAERACGDGDHRESRAVAGSRRSRRVASNPSRSPIRRSMKITSGRCSTRQFDRLEAASGRDDADAGALEQAGEDPPADRAVVDDERRHVLVPARACASSVGAVSPDRRSPCDASAPGTSGKAKKKRLPCPGTLSTLSSSPMLRPGAG